MKPRRKIVVHLSIVAAVFMILTEEIIQICKFEINLLWDLASTRNCQGIFCISDFKEN